MNNPKSICADCERVEILGVASMLWRCSADSYIDPVSGEIRGELCQTKNISGDCPDFIKQKDEDFLINKLREYGERERHNVC